MRTFSGQHLSYRANFPTSSACPFPLGSRPIPKHLVWLFVVFAMYLVAPVADVPFLNISLSAPLLYLVALGLLVQYKLRGFKSLRRWTVFPLVFWWGMAASFLINWALSSDTSTDAASLVTVLRFGYWMVAFLLTVYVAHRAQLGPRMPLYFALALVALGCVVLLERLALGTISAGGISTLTGLSQNAYGWQFSTFSPYLLVFAFTGKGRAQIFGITGILLVWLAAVVNMSRSSWLAIMVGFLVFLFLYSMARSLVRGVAQSALAISLAVAAIVFIPEAVKGMVLTRYQTFQRLDEDKSYQIRVLMLQKAWRLFKEHPLFGVGPSRFTRSSTPLDTSHVLRYAPQEHFNVKSAHNSYALLLAEGGLASGVPFAILLLVLLVRGARAAVFLCRRGEPWALGVYASFIGMSVHLWSLAGLTATAPWVTYGLVAAAIERARKLRGLASHKGRFV